MGDRNPRRFEKLDYMKELLVAGVRASNLGIILLDSQTRWESLNAAITRETRIPVEQHIGKSTREIVGELARQIDKSRRVQQLGLFVVNVTAERTSTEILKALATNSKVRMAQAAGILERFDQSVRAYHSHLRMSLCKLACPSTEAARRADGFRLSLEHLDDDIRLMQELIYAVIAQFPVPEC